jgi:hypothetical protein
LHIIYLVTGKYLQRRRAVDRLFLWAEVGSSLLPLIRPIVPYLVREE